MGSRVLMQPDGHQPLMPVPAELHPTPGSAAPFHCHQVAVMSMFGGFGFVAVPGSETLFTCQCSTAKRGSI